MRWNFQDLESRESLPEWVAPLRTFLLDRGFEEVAEYFPDVFGNITLRYTRDLVIEAFLDRSEWYVTLRPLGGEQHFRGIELWVACLDGVEVEMSDPDVAVVVDVLMKRFDGIVEYVKRPDAEDCVKPMQRKRGRFLLGLPPDGPDS